MGQREGVKITLEFVAVKKDAKDLGMVQSNQKEEHRQAYCPQFAPLVAVGITLKSDCWKTIVKRGQRQKRAAVRREVAHKKSAW